MLGALAHVGCEAMNGDSGSNDRGGFWASPVEILVYDRGEPAISYK